MKIKLLQTVIFMLTAAAAGLTAAPVTVMAGTSPLVTTQWLEQNLAAENLVIIDVRTTTNYGVGHIPGSFNMPYIAWEPFNEKQKCPLMPEEKYFSEMMQAMGVNGSSHVVIYDHGNSIGDATRGCTCVWILEAMGHTNVSYLDGGFTKWTFEGRIIDNKKSEGKAGDFAAKIDHSKVVTMDQVVNKMKNKDTVLLDARNSNQHFGDDTRGDVERSGHIPGSINLPAPFLDHAGVNRAPATIKPEKQLVDIVNGVGIPDDKNREIIVYCNTGQYAGMNYFVLHDILGYKNVSVYDGSMIEYALNDKLPLVNFTWGSSAR